MSTKKTWREAEMNGIVVPVTILLVVCLAVVALKQVVPSSNEGFAVPECPTSAVRNDKGQIVAGGKTFNSLSDYTSYLSDLYAQGAKCIPPQVLPVTPDQPRGIIGGLNNNVEPPEGIQDQNATRTVFDYDPNNEQTSAKTPINKLDDYEYSRIFKSESQFRYALTPESKSEMLSKYVLDWANLPFNSQERADKEDGFNAIRMEGGFREPKSGVFFTNMETPTIATPDEEAAKARERALLSQYRPTDISKHIIDSETEAVAKLVNDVYAGDKNYEPVVTKTGENQYEVTELRPKSRKELWEDAQTQKDVLREGIGHPKPSVEISNQMADDPYFDKGGVEDRSNGRFWKYDDFNKWTPGLERMFAPTFSTQEWQ